ncbi:TPA: prophage tail fiber N-terminal domain-containing protein [Yersinia enterocolitica]|nr:prophage tail fiber N-terminal domain-containing protein [Yersinia enterocolitica]
MSVKISGTLIDGAGIPMSWCDIILKACVNTSDVVTRTVAQIKTDVAGEYSFDAQFFSEYPGKVLRRNTGSLSAAIGSVAGCSLPVL